MKKSRIAKLALMGSSMAALAATLGTSTYAWYVANDTATVSGMTGATAGTEASGNLLVAQLQAASGTGVLSVAGNWGNQLGEVSLKQIPNLNPVTKDTQEITPSGANVTATGWHDVYNAPVAQADAYGYYAFGIWSTDKVNVNVKLGVANTTTTMKTQTLYSSSGAPTDTAINATFTKDALEALRMEVIQVALTDDLTISTVLSTTPLDLWCPGDTFYNLDHSAAYTRKSGAKAGGNANQYYQAIMGQAPAGGTSSAATSTLTSGTYGLTLTKDQRTVLLFRYWLEGTDTDCFDSCIGQTFSFAFEFEAVAPSNNNSGNGGN